MVERHGGVFGGCWCTWFHTMPADKERTYEANRALTCRLVQEGRAHAALVVDGDDAGRRQSVLHDGTRSLFERAGFTYVRAKGAGSCVMRRTVP